MNGCGIDGNTILKLFLIFEIKVSKLRLINTPFSSQISLMDMPRFIIRFGLSQNIDINSQPLGIKIDLGRNIVLKTNRILPFPKK